MVSGAHGTSEHKPVEHKHSPVTARVEKRTGSLAVTTVEVRGKEGTLFSTGIGTYRIFPGKGAITSTYSQ